MFFCFFALRSVLFKQLPARRWGQGVRCFAWAGDDVDGALWRASFFKKAHVAAWGAGLRAGWGNGAASAAHAGCVRCAYGVILA